MSAAAKFVSAGRFIAIDPWQHVRRTLPHDVLLLGLRGCLHIAQEDVPYQMRFGNIVHLRAGVEHYGYEEDRDVSYYWVHYVPLEGAPALPDFSTSPSSESILTLFRQLLHFSHRSEKEQELMDYTLSALLYEAAHQIRAALPDHTRREFADILEWIRINLSHSITLQDIAAEFHYSPKYFSNMFLRRYNISFSEYLQEQRMNRACSMLLNTTKTIREIAVSCGYRDEKYFMKVFKSKMGITAKAYRRGLGDVHMNSH